VKTQSCSWNRSLVFWGIITILGVLSLYVVRGILLPFIAGLIIAYLLNPVIERLERLYIPRALGAGVLILLSFLTIIEFFLFSIPFLQSELIAFAKRLPVYGEKLYELSYPFLNQFSDLISVDDLEKLKEKASSYIGDMARWSLSAVVGILGNTLALANLISLIILTPVVAFYLLRDWPKFILNIEKLLPQEHRKAILSQFSQINKTLGSYLRGQCLVCLFLAAIYSIGLMLTGLDYALTIGIATGILAFIPYIGFLIGLLSAVGLAIAQSQDWTLVGWVGLVFLTGLFVESYFLTPTLIGERIGLHPVWIIFALLCGGLLFGFMGMFLAMPVAATLGVIVRFFIAKYFHSNFYRGAV
jgi:predicted PurR-regulated permease PerM